MEMLQRKLAESELKRAEAVKQLKSLSVSEYRCFIAGYYSCVYRFSTINLKDSITTWRKSESN